MTFRRYRCALGTLAPRSPWLSQARSKLKQSALSDQLFRRLQDYRRSCDESSGDAVVGDRAAQLKGLPGAYNQGQQGNPRALDVTDAQDRTCQRWWLLTPESKAQGICACQSTTSGNLLIRTTKLCEASWKRLEGMHGKKLLSCCGVTASLQQLEREEKIAFRQAV